uniref:Putative CLAVATA3/ESR (CLE)-related protein 13-like n=1 Tax=Davidia involucrata TaxID=16924 RepID=A0A5B7BAC2_DAVIN
MVFKVPHSITLILWLSLLLSLFHGRSSFTFKHIFNNKDGHLSLSDHHTLTSSRKALATKFDFTPFMQHHRRHVRADPQENEIDPRYGVENRLVPTGPNRLHH